MSFAATIGYPVLQGATYSLASVDRHQACVEHLHRINTEERRRLCAEKERSSLAKQKMLANMSILHSEPAKITVKTAATVSERIDEAVASWQAGRDPRLEEFSAAHHMKVEEVAAEKERQSQRRCSCCYLLQP